MKRTISAQIHMVLLILCIFPLLLTAQNNSQFAYIDSCIGEQKLEAYTKACTQAASQNNSKDEFMLLHAYQKEARKQNHMKHETQARTLLLYAFYNNNLSDSLNVYMQDDLSFMKKHAQWVNYYSCRSLLVERMLFDKHLQSALREAKSMYQDALRQDVEYGIGISAYLIASCYQGMNRHEEAIKFFEKSEKPFLEENNSGQLHNLYGMGWQSLAALHRYDEILQLTNRWETMWKSYCKANKLQLSDISSYYTVCLLARAHAYTKTKELVDARISLDSAQVFAHNQRKITRLLLLKEEALYEEAINNYPRALAHLNERLSIQLKLNNRISSIETEEMRARIFSKQYNYQEAAKLYETLIADKDSLTHLNLAAQLDDLSRIYSVDKLKKQNNRMKRMRNIAITICLVLILIIAAYLYFKSQLHAKNITIVKYIEQKKTTLQQLALIKDVEVESPESLLFDKITKILQDPEIIACTSLDREVLARMLNTNSTYIANAIKKQANMRVVEYINKVRTEHACLLIKQDEKISFQAVWAICGFNSRPTFYRSFSEHTGMSPNSYREVVKAKN